ncbi:unnamed protein product [Meloidogyne enterolobii]|uniref:Uncharacterized protein n=1 Tax=Meloidogyne enterolobii TaxID=390850 RepID=A0ACB0Y3J1_MELEN
MEQQQQNNNIKINSRKQRNDVIPIELLSDVFKSSNVSLKELKTSSRHLWKEIYEPLSLPSSIKSMDELKKKLKQVVIFKNMEEGGLIKYWHKVAKNILTSSGIVYSLVGESFRKMKLILMSEQKQLGQQAQDSVNELIVSTGAADLLKTLIDRDSRPLLLKALHHIESQNKKNKQLLKWVKKQAQQLEQQGSLDKEMIAEVRNFFSMPPYEETDSVKETLTRSKSNPSKPNNSPIKCKDCGGSYATQKSFKQHFGHRPHIEAVKAKKRQREAEEGDQKSKGGEEPEQEELDDDPLAPSSSKKVAR